MRISYEADLSTKQYQAEEDSRFPGTDGYPWGTQGAKPEKGEGTEETDCYDTTETGSLVERSGKLSQGRERFPKGARLTRRSEFLSLSSRGKEVYTPHFIVISRANASEVHRLGITVSAKIGGAVIRNRIKRYLREYFRRHQNSLSAHRDLLIIARKGAGDLSHDQVVRELGKACTSLWS